MIKPELVDGCLHFTFRGEDQQVDLLLLKLACDDVERLHNLPVVDNRVQYTAEFLSDLSQKFDRVNLLAECTPTAAFQLWIIAGKEMEGLKKNTESLRSLPDGSQDQTPLDQDH